MAKQFYFPPVQTKADGKCRRVGFELEFAGLDLETAADVLANALDGEVQPETEAECTVKTRLGDFQIELDWQFAKTTARQRAEEREQDPASDADDRDRLMAWITRLAGQIVPMEVVCPPVALDELETLDAAVPALREAGALGTEEALLYAFGVHINPDIPDLTPATLTRYLKAFCISQAWLMKAHKVDLMRRVTPYINLYPQPYLARVCRYENPTMAQVMLDYLEFNPTRNRALDLTPLIKHIDATAVEPLKDSRINARPTFHYRIPNCEIEQADWSLADSWNIWCVVEQLAADPELLDRLSAECADYYEKVVTLEAPSWHEDLDNLRARIAPGGDSAPA